MEQIRSKWLVLVFATFMPIAHVIMGLVFCAWLFTGPPSRLIPRLFSSRPR